MKNINRIDFRDQISSNKRKSFILLVVVFAFLIVLGYVISNLVNPGFVFIVFIFSIIFSISYLLFSYYNSAKIAVLSVGAKEAKRSDYKLYYSLVEGLTLASGLPMPKLYILHSPQINAFASGRDPTHSIICVTTGALEKLEKRELEGVLAHELGHVESYDIRYMTLVAVLVGMVSILSEIFLRSLWFKGDNNRKEGSIFIVIGIILAILAPIFVSLVQLAISRKRELTADASAVKFTRYPDGLINALTKIKSENYSEKKVNKAMAHLFFSNPLNNLSSTHPPIEKRIELLKKM
jgi:heat shock protein HtpX